MMSDRESGDEQPQSQRQASNGATGSDSGQQQQSNELELATKMLQIQSKRFYLDVKQNRRGKFIKVAEIGADGRRSQIFLALSTAADFRDHLGTFSEFYSQLGPPNPDTVPEDGKLKSEMMIKDNRRYYLDLKENARGRFLRVIEIYSCPTIFVKLKKIVYSLYTSIMSIIGFPNHNSWRPTFSSCYPSVMDDRVP
uniref:Transcriptional activator protein Pur-beta n=1 Tax=Sipha flava TaxID=143950 RepID=A0A2S2Q4A9_9HEMI